MAKLAIKGHETRCKEVIEILEMLGGKNKFEDISFIKPYHFLYVDDDYYTEIGWEFIGDDNNYEEFVIYTLEEFLEKYPYKVGDRVSYRADKLLETHVITNMRWDSDNDCVLYYLDNCDIIKVDDILYKIGSPEDNIPTIQDKTTVETIKGTFKPSEGTLIKIDFTRELCIADEVEVVLGDYEFVLKDGKTYFVKKKPVYPKTYDECCNILGIEDRENGYCGYEYELLGEFQKLYICRNAYWKIAGEEMGLDKHWEPDWNNLSTNHEFIKINKGCFTYSSRVLAFPTEEIRDEFYKNFKSSIEQCKELL